jgi:hypothetical protein
MVATNLHRLGVCVKFIQQILRHANITTTMNIYAKTVSVAAANAMRDVCNYRATREARQHANDVEVFSGSSQQVSTLDIVTRDLAETGESNPRTGGNRGKGRKNDEMYV